MAIQRNITDDDEWFWRRVDRSSECWVWTGAVGKHGYGNLRRAGRYWRAHRLSYTLAVGPIPDGLPLDHLCRNTRCVRPEHLEPVTTRENCRRGIRAKNPLCAQGHERNSTNTFVDSFGKKHCRVCDRIRHARARGKAA